MKEKITTMLIVFVITLGVYAADVKTVGIGSGANKVIATQTALRNALENVYGVYIASSTTISKDTILTDEISAVSFGKIVTYKVLDSTTDVSGEITVTVDATVSLDKLATFVGENTGTSVKFDGAGWGMQHRMERLNIENEEKAAEDIFKAIIALDIELTNKIEILKIRHHSTSDSSTQKGSYNPYHRDRDNRTTELWRENCIEITVKYDRKHKHNVNRDCLIQLADNAFETLKDPKTKCFRSKHTDSLYWCLMTYINYTSLTFAITDEAGHIYPIFVNPKYPDDYIDSSYWYRFFKIFQDYDWDDINHNPNVYYNRELGFNWYSLIHAYPSGFTRDGNKLRINIFYTTEQLENVRNFTVVPIPQPLINRIKDYFLYK